MMIRALPFLLPLTLASLTCGMTREEALLAEVARDTVAPDEYRLDRLSVQGGFLGGFGALGASGTVYRAALPGFEASAEAANRAVGVGTDAGVQAGLFWNFGKGSAGVGCLYSSFAAEGTDAREGLETEAKVTSEFLAGTLTGRLPVGTPRLQVRAGGGLGALVLRREIGASDALRNRYTVGTRSAGLGWMASAGLEFRLFPALTLLAEGRWIGAGMDRQSRTTGANGGSVSRESMVLVGSEGDASRFCGVLGVLVEFGLF